MNQSLTNTIGAALIITGSLTAQSARAAERGFYVGVYYGQTDKASEEGPYVALGDHICCCRLVFFEAIGG